MPSTNAKSASSGTDRKEPGTQCKAPRGESRVAVLSKQASATDRKLVPADPITGAYAEPGRGFTSGGAGLFSKAGDDLRFARMLANDGEIHGARLDEGGNRHGDESRRPTRRSREETPRFHRGPRTCLGFGCVVATISCMRTCPAEPTVMLLFAQHIPFREHGIFAPVYAAGRAALH